MWNKLFYLLHMRMHSVTWLNSRWWLAAWRYAVRKIVKKFGMSSLYGAYSPEESLWVVSNSKKGTKHTVGGSFSSEFSACVIIAELWRLEVARLGILLAIFAFFKTTPYRIIFNILFRKFSLPHRLTLLCSNVVQELIRRWDSERELFTTNWHTYFKIPKK